MGIDGFHTATKSNLEPKHLSSYANQRIGIDASAWLHRGTVMYSYEILTETEPWKAASASASGSTPPPWIDYPLRLLALLENNNITPVVVFDGVSSPAKAPTSAKRRERKEAARAKGMELLARGDEAAARKVLMGAFEVTPAMTSELIVELKRRKVEFVVAPYEADAQLAWMASVGAIQGIITEDSDLFAYGCTKPILFKLSPSGTVEELTMSRVLADDTNGDLRGWSVEELRALCVLSGCDFLPSIRGMGFKTVLKVMTKFGTRSGPETLERTLAQLRKMDRWKEGASDAYCAAAARAVEAFSHGLVYDVERRVCVYINADAMREVVDGEDVDLTHLGPRLVRGEAGLLERVCRGEVCGRTFEEIKSPGQTGPLAVAFGLIKQKEKEKEKEKKGGIFSFVYDQDGSGKAEAKGVATGNRKENAGANEGLRAVVSPEKKKRKGAMHKFIEFWRPAGTSTANERRAE